MAYKAMVSGEVRYNYFQNEPHMWMISDSVGYGNTNRKEDVMLVQYLINRVANLKKIAMDGIFGSKTYGAIKQYQENYLWCKIDGRVSAHDGSNYKTLDGTKERTIYALNWDYQVTTSLLVYYKDIRMDPHLPILLQSALS